jgi:hypothetical protein
MKYDEAERLVELRGLSEEERKELQYHWRVWARSSQVPPKSDWRVWMILAGRGFGKTRAGAEWVRAVAAALPEARIALVAASLGEARAVMVEGESGLLAISPPTAYPDFEPSLRRLTWPNGAVATLYSAAEPESLRGPQHSHACRAGAERILRQRGPCTYRRTALLRDRRRGEHAPGDAGGWHGMVDRIGRERCMDRERRRDRMPSDGELDFRAAT